jgi:predicted RNase H-like HicB family nuclease
MTRLTLSAVIHREGDWFVAQCPEAGTASQGRTVEEAVANLREATELYLEEEGIEAPVEPALLTSFCVDVADAEAA